MQFSNSFKKNLVLFVVVAVVLSVCSGQTAFAGSIVGWGENDYGQVSPPDGNDYVAIAGDCHHCLALRQDGSIVGWGKDIYGQATPPAGSDYVAIDAGGLHSLALKQDGSIVGWGHDFHGQATPPTGSDYVAIGAGWEHSLALKQDGSIVGWGWDYYGQASPPAGSDYVAITAGYHHCLALKQDGSIVGWGDNGDGQATPPDGNDYVAIAAGRYHSLALKQDGSIIGWGWDEDGQATPPEGSDYVAIAAGHFHCLALRQDSSIVGWGRNADRDGDYCGQATPPTGSDYVAIAGGGCYSLAIEYIPKHTLTLSSTAGGYISVPGEGVFSYEHSSSVPIVASADTGYHFVNWTGTAVDAGNVANASVANTTVTVDADCTLQVNFEVTPIIFYISAVTGDDNNDGLSPETAFATIQKGIESASDGDVVLVYPGIYTGEINFLGKAITVQGAEGAAVIENPDYFAVSFYYSEGPDSILKNFVIENSFMAVFIAGSSPTIRNVTVVNNEYGIESYAGAEPNISNSIFRDNIYSDLYGCEVRYSCTAEPGEGNIDVDPLFAAPDNGDYHLLSERGRYWAGHDVWVLDEVTSLCVDGGDPAADCSDEPMPNGGCINMGAYGGTAYASMKELRLGAGDINHDGWVNMTDFMMFAENWLTYEPLTSNWPPMVSIIGPQEGASLYPYEIPIEAYAGDIDGWVEIVEFFADGNQIGGDDDGSDGWKAVWENPIEGTYNIDAKATDDDGAVATSLPIEVHIGGGGKGRFCFTDDAGVWVDGELVRFSEVIAGQRVAGFGGACITGCPKRVEYIDEHEGVFFECYDVVLESGNHISVVGSHLFLTDSGRWSSVEDLRTGMKLQSMHDLIGIGSIARRPLPYIGRVYNLKVKDGDRYLVGKDGIIVRDY